MCYNLGVPDLYIPHVFSTLGFGKNRISALVPPHAHASRLFLSFVSQGQYEDEFYWTCLPNNISTLLGGQCNNTAYRMVSLYIGSELVFSSAVRPYIFSGGVDPFLWRPIVAISTLRLLPMIFDLTPFASLFHHVTQNVTFCISTFSNSFFYLAANLHFTVDSDVLSGSLLFNNLPDLEKRVNTPVLNSHLDINGSSIAGFVEVSGSFTATAVGVVNFKNGSSVKTQTQIDVICSNQQKWFINSTELNLFLEHLTSISAETTVNGLLSFRERINFPVFMNQTSSSIFVVGEVSPASEPVLEGRRISGDSCALFWVGRSYPN